MARALRPLLVLALLVAAALPVFAAQTYATVIVKKDGTVEALIRAAAEPGLNAYPAPAPPLPATIIAEVDGKTVPVVYDNGTIYVATDKPANVTITYLVNTTVRDGYAEFSLGRGRVLLRLEPGVVLLNLPQGIEGVKQLPDGSLEVVLEGPAVIRYTVAQPPQQPTTTTTAATTATATTPPTTTTPATRTTTTTATTRTATSSPAATATTTTAAPTRTTAGATTQPATTTTQPATQPPAATATVTATGATTAPRAGGAPTAAIAAIVVAVAAAVAALLLRGRRGAAPAPSLSGEPPGSPGGGGAESAVTVQPRGLDEVDRRILEKLREHGGTMLQSQLLRETGLPKTTLWRHVQKLEKLGYIKVVREGRSNRLILRRDAW